jgi:hypothetical protein
MVNRNAWKAFALTGLGVRVPPSPLSGRFVIIDVCYL